MNIREEIDKIVADFTESEFPELHAHYVDDDDNAAERMRIKLMNLFAKFGEEIIGGMDDRTPDEVVRRIYELNLGMVDEQTVRQAQDQTVTQRNQLRAEQRHTLTTLLGREEKNNE